MTSSRVLTIQVNSTDLTSWNFKTVEGLNALKIENSLHLNSIEGIIPARTYFFKNCSSLSDISNFHTIMRPTTEEIIFKNCEIKIGGLNLLKIPSLCYLSYEGYNIRAMKAFGIIERYLHTSLEDNKATRNKIFLLCKAELEREGLSEFTKIGF